MNQCSSAHVSQWRFLGCKESVPETKGARNWSSLLVPIRPWVSRDRRKFGYEVEIHTWKPHYVRPIFLCAVFPFSFIKFWIDIERWVQISIRSGIRTDLSRQCCSWLEPTRLWITAQNLDRFFESCVRLISPFRSRIDGRTQRDITHSKHSTKRYQKWQHKIHEWTRCC